MTATAHVGDRVIGGDAAPYVIAELSGNHNGDLGRAKAILDAAAEAGVDAVKLQTYTADSLTIDSDAAPFLLRGGTAWDGRRLHDLYREAATPWSWTGPLFEHGRSLGVDVFSTPFDDAAVRLLEEFDPPAHKVASFELNDHELLRTVAGTGRTIIASTGMATAAEIDQAITVLRDSGATEIVLLRCNSAYPATTAEMDLRSIPDMAERWQVPIGLSDHTLTTTATLVAVALGASVIEKHVTLSRADPGPDSGFSLEPQELAHLVTAVKEASAATGQVRYGPSPSEEPSQIFRRSLFVVADVEANEVLTRDNVRSIRPGDGIAPRFLPDVLGRQTVRSAPRGTPLTWDLLSDP